MKTNEIITACTAIYGAVTGTVALVWQRKDRAARRIRRNEDGRLYVEYKAIKKDADGYLIPGYGRIDIDESTVAEAKKQNAKVAFYCEEITASSETTPHYVILETTPL